LEQRYERGNETRPASLETPVYRSALEQNFQRRVLKGKTEKEKIGNLAKTKEKRGADLIKTKKEKKFAYYTYLLQCRDGTLYCGFTDDLEKRLKAHGAGKGAKDTRSRPPPRRASREEFATKNEAMSREYFIKRMPRSKKLALIEEYERKK